MSQSDPELEDESRNKKTEKIFKLQGGDMVCRYVGYRKRGDREMVIELQFTFDGDTNPRIVGNVKCKCNVLR